MKRREKVSLLKQMYKQAILEHSKRDIGWYLKRMEDLTSADLSDPVIQNELRSVTNIVINRFEEMKEEEAEKKIKKPIGFRP